VEKVVSDEMTEVLKTQFDVRSRCEGKTAMLFVGGSRAHHYQTLFAEMGMKTVAAGYEFAHRDDYEGRRVLPTVKVDADSRNIEQLGSGPRRNALPAAQRPGRTRATRNRRRRRERLPGQ